MNLYAVAGKPILHSRSPQIHAALAGRGGAAYCRVRADEAEQIVSLLRDGIFAGMNVTAPFKEAVAPLLDRLDESATATGAVNTIVACNGRIEGANTDPDGIVGALREAGIDPAGSNALVLGAGGAGRAAVFALTKSGAHVTVVNRTEARARACAADFGCRCEPWANLRRALSESRLIVSTLPVERIPFPAEWLPQEAAVFDADYRSRPLARAAVERGLPIVDGTEWLLFQALAAFQRFHDFPAARSAIDAARTALQAPIEKKRGAALIGFMGSGKSTVGPKLAALLGWSFVDIDSRIEQREGMTVSEIFGRKGEPHFRRLEQETVLAVAGQERTLIACGGGAILDPLIREALRRHGFVVWLYTPLAETRRRDLRGRPLLGEGSPEAESIFEKRKSLYGETADLLVFNRKEPEEVARDIADEIGPFIGS